MHEENNKRRPSPPEIPVSKNLAEEKGDGDILSDVLGSYTGIPIDSEMPEQDADDL
jgi:hypothetical protein